MNSPNQIVNQAKLIRAEVSNHLYKVLQCEKYAINKKVLNFNDDNTTFEIIYFFQDKSELRIANPDNCRFTYAVSSGNCPFTKVMSNVC